MHVHESKDLRLGVTEGVEDCAGFEVGMSREVDHHLHADGPVILMIAGGQAEAFVELAANGSHRSVADHGQSGPNVHAGHEAIGRIALEIGALVNEPHADHLIAVDERAGHRGGGPHLHGAGAHDLCPDPLHELAH